MVAVGACVLPVPGQAVLGVSGFLASLAREDQGPGSLWVLALPDKQGALVSAPPPRRRVRVSQGAGLGQRTKAQAPGERGSDRSGTGMADPEEVACRPAVARNTGFIHPVTAAHWRLHLG